MKKIYEILDELRAENRTKYKLLILKEYEDREDLKRLLKLTYDKVVYTYGIGIKRIPNVTAIGNEDIMWGLDMIESKLSSRKITGNKAVTFLSDVFKKMNPQDKEILIKTLRRDLRIDLGKTEINKVFKSLIVKPPYMRCSTFSKKLLEKISFPAILQLKADGRYTSAEVEDGNVRFVSRSGEEKEFPVLEQYFKNLPNGVYVGEMLVRGMSDRSEANGRINSDNPPHDDIYMQIWDFITWDEWSRPKDKKNKMFYTERFAQLRNNIIENEHLSIIETHLVSNIEEAIVIIKHWVESGLEGGILKDEKNIFVSHDSPTQLKIKLKISVEMRITGFVEGTPGTSRAKTFGSLLYANDEGTIQGSVSGLSDKLLKEINNNRNEWLGKVIEIVCNDITKARNSTTYALSHPRFSEDRSNEKDTTNTLKEAFENKEMSFSLESLLRGEKCL